VIVKKGKTVQGLSSGDKVLLSFNHCGSCSECQAGHPAYCHSLVPLNFGGKRLDGSHTITLQTGGGVHSNFFGQSSFAKLAIVNAASVVKVVAETPLDLFAPLGCGIQTGAGAVLNTLDVSSGASLVVWGVGAVGLSSIMAGKIREANPIVAVDVLDSRLALAEKLGATHVVNGRDPDVVQKVQALCPPNGAQFAVDATGVPKVVENMIDSLGSRGKAATVGAPSPGVRAGLDIFQQLILGRSYLGCCEGDAIPKLVGLPRSPNFCR
jgi:Zn-dependent alcohol dehydrogenase